MANWYTRLISLLIFLCFSCSAQAGNLINSYRYVSGGEPCTTPTTGDTLNEGFLTGYTTSPNTWTETGAGTLTANFSLSGSPPDDTCDLGLNVVISGDQETYTTWDNGSTIDSAAVMTNIVSIVYIDSITFATAFGSMEYLHWDDNTGTSTAGTARVDFSNSSGTYRFVAKGATNSTPITFIEDTWYRIWLHLDTTAASSYLDIDSWNGSSWVDVDQQNFTRNDLDGRYLRTGVNKDAAIGYAADLEIGYDYIDTP